MFYQPELIIYLWMLPVLAMVVLPALWTMTCMLYRAIERSRLVDVRGFIDLNASQSDGLEEEDIRLHPRIRIEGPKANVARQVKCCQTHVANITCQGICLTNIPQKICNEADDKLKVVFRTRERDYKMFVQPKWMKEEGKCSMIGAEIISVSAGWKYFVEGLCQPTVTEAA